MTTTDSKIAAYCVEPALPQRCTSCVPGAVVLAAAAGWFVWASLLGASPAPVKRVVTGPAPCGEAAAAGSLWVATDRGSLVRIDPRTNRVTLRRSIGRGACAMTGEAGAIWVTNYLRSSVLRVDLRSGRVRSIAVDAGPFDALIAFGRLWVTAWEAGRLDEVDLGTLRVVRRIDVGPRPVGLASRAGGVWVGFGRDATAIARVDPASGIVERIEVGDPRPGWFVRGTRDFWIQANDGDVLHVDPATRRVLARLHVGRTLARGAAAADGTIWVPDKEQSVVYRIDPARERVIDSFPAGPGAFQVLRAFGSMWVISYAGDDVWRFKP